MNSIEERLWSYIDGTCTALEREEIAVLIISNEDYKQQYEDLLQLHTDFGQLELDEPPMAFTYNVMEQIRTQEARVPLKAAINNRIIYFIAGFFILTITAVLIFALRDINFSSTTATAFKLPVKINSSAFASAFTGPWMKGFLFFDVVLGLFLLDTYLRKKHRHVIMK